MFPGEGGGFNGGNMSQIEELKLLISERLHAATSEILGAIERTLTEYEEQACRLKEENERSRSLLDIIVKSKLSEKEASQTKKSPPSSSSGHRPSESKNKRNTLNTPSDLKCLFTSRADFLKAEDENGNCPYCIKKIQATEIHLMKRHYFYAVHFIQGGIEKFVIPCMCKDKIQGRSHWHCPYCLKIIYRKCNFEAHLLKMHGYVTLQQTPDADVNQSSAAVLGEEVLLSPEPWSHQELNSLEQQASLLHEIKQEPEQVSLPAVKYSEEQQLIQKVNNQTGQQSLQPNHAPDSSFSIVCVDSFIQDISEIRSVHSGMGPAHPNSSTQAMETGLGSEVRATLEPAGESQHTSGNSSVAENGSSRKTEKWKQTQTPCSSVKALNVKRKKCVKRSVSLKVNNPTQLSTSHNPTGSHCCKACGKVFHYMYTLRAHVQTHAVDKIHVCGICGKHLESTDSLVQHLQSHTKRKKCGRCGKQFSSSSRLKRHTKFHRPKVLNIMSLA